MYIAFPILDLRLSRFLKVETYFWKLSFNVAMPCQWSLAHRGFQQTKVFHIIRTLQIPSMPGRQWLVMKRLWITGSSRFWITGALFRPCNYQPLGMCSIFCPVQWWCFLKSNIFSLHWWSFLNDYAKHDSRQSSLSLISHSTKTGTRQNFCYIRHQMKISQIFTQG